MHKCALSFSYWGNGRSSMSRKLKTVLAVILGVVLFAGGCTAGFLLDRGDQDRKLAAMQMLVDQYYLGETEEIQFKEGVYKGFMEQLNDPYSVYYTEEEYNELMEDDSGLYVGIGVVVSQNIYTREVLITRVFQNGPAAKAGLQRYDIILAVDGVDVADMELTDIVDMIRGAADDKVVLTVNRDGKEMDIESERGTVKAEMVEYQMLDEDSGYIVIYEFIETTYDDFVKGYTELTEAGMENLILDLRSNPGGLLDQVYMVSDAFLPAGSVVVSTEDNRGNKEYLKAENEDTIDIPLVVLTDGYSASASEILAGVIKDYELGTLMGQTTYGKGIVQRIFPLSDGSAIKMTISKYFTPSGDYIHDKGIEPDIVLEEMYIEEKGDTILDDTWIQAALKVLEN
ncbi:MAG: S41 family peptidase [Lachnospiraceae bacterium]|nr:S41 family peptidase [Lachnospiraceae bacterium]